MNIIILTSILYSLTIPALHPDIIEQDGNLFLISGSYEYSLIPSKPLYTLNHLIGNPVGTDTGVKFRFGRMNGTLHYGFIKNTRYPQTVFFKQSETIEKGKANIDILHKLANEYDMVNWQKNGFGTIGYRFITGKGHILYDGKVAFIWKDRFIINSASITVGPFINFAEDGNSHTNIRISFDTLQPTNATIFARHDNGPVLNFNDNILSNHHEINLTNLTPNTKYFYTVQTRTSKHSYTENYSFKTAPIPGSRKPFSFAYTSDSREGKGGSERNSAGVNTYIMKKVAALASAKKVAFVQFSGDMINGYLNNIEQTEIQYHSWKKVIEPFAHYIPFVTTMGNHEALLNTFVHASLTNIKLDKFPFETDSAEAIFAKQFVNPTNGPISEDGAFYDPDPNQLDFPSYKENVFYYIYDNIAMVVLNSNYWYSPSVVREPKVGGNLNGYLMENQLEWLRNTLDILDNNVNIDFVFVTQHTPAFPTSWHVRDDMWYKGNNEMKAVVKNANGDNLITSGIIEQRDKYLQILMRSKKVVGMLTGDEHNFNWLQIDKNVNIYPKNWDKADIRQLPEFRTIYQINNGTAGAPYSSKASTPWKEHVKNFTTQNAVVFFHINGNSIKIEVIDPDTLDIILQF
ncbi:metallophosphoesterase family protein [Candidatus Halobeggiatoa sp. HSG11]|nr:metallophosphoesterase family protein [Candidatus Halobeggiatoa sp. HSG11]